MAQGQQDKQHYEQRRELSEPGPFLSPGLCVTYSPPSVIVHCSVNTHVYIILTSVLLSFFPSSCPITLIVVEVEWGPRAFFFLFPPLVIVTSWNQTPRDLILSTSRVLKVPLSLLQKLLKSLYLLAQKSIMKLVLLDVSLLSNVLSNQLFLCQFIKNIKLKLQYKNAQQFATLWVKKHLEGSLGTNSYG